MKLTPYLAFDGNCQEAMEYYKELLNGTLDVKKFADAPETMETPDFMMQKVMHAQLQFGDQKIYACDTMQPNLVRGNDLHLSLNIIDAEKAAAVFNGLAEGGEINMPFKDVFWGGKFGMVKDRFGTQWMISTEEMGAST
ncbi:VOC family protein [Zeaxanthinibacter enoshimensis]|uniref:VOC family protein n=1 Tax=Zeaxanthinibacter enoshimensis TaxID=392009 RepID=UPI003563E08C